MPSLTSPARAPRPARGARRGGPVGDAALPAPGSAAPVRRRGRTVFRYAFALPSILLVLLFFAIPFIANGLFAFTRWTGYSSVITWDGLSNFRLLQQLGVLSHATEVTAIYAVTSMLVQNVVGLALALAMQRTTRGNSVFRSLFFIPVLISPLAAGYIWSAALATNGPVNAVISVFVPGGFHYAWLGHNLSALICVACVDAWKWTGLVTLVYIAGLNRIPERISEAALLDGAGPWRRLRSVTFPLLAPALTFNVVITLVGAFSALDVVFSTTGGGPGDATAVLNVALYNEYGQSFFGMASSLGFVITLLVVLTAVPLITWLRRREVQM
ncbi:sugar ABC transporter permease [Actinospica sp. MGRD01-02]|uniref:Sugar ABC transporter permease n=1 Tax=Actinospica acidithermotolerans TaxID=2828514 RepID=A0A941EAL3_9ACTN|nr:sugar ABC transporter permease [Actinospica acidithermotolerans]MBR7826968.1 sugar ABC transporter permease [Actinospica acidithermotolerans]